MDSSLSFGRLVRNLLLLAAFGFVILLFAKPLLTAFAVVLACALVGFLMWLPLHTLVFRQNAPVRQHFEQGRALSARALAGMYLGGARLAEGAALVGPMLLEVGSGAVLGGLLVWAYSGSPVEPEALAVGVLAGAASGVLVVLARRQPATEE